MLLCEYLAQNNLHFHFFPFCKWCPRFLQWDNIVLYIVKDVHPDYLPGWQQELTISTGSQGNPMLLLREHRYLYWAKSWRKGAPPNSLAFTVNPRATSYQSVCPTCRPPPKVLPRPSRWRVIALHAEHNLTYQASSERLNPTSTRLGNTIISPELSNLAVRVPENLNVVVSLKMKLLRNPGLWWGHKVLEMGGLLFMPTASSQKEN